MRQKSPAVAYSFDRALLYSGVTSAPPSVAARDKRHFKTARRDSRIKRKKWRAFFLTVLSRRRRIDVSRILADVITAEE
jgi:hypothetical protein